MTSITKNFPQIFIRGVLVVLATALLYGLLSFGGQSSGGNGAVTIYAYCDMLSQDDFEAFTEKTGIPVVVRHFETIEEVVTKLLFTGDDAIDIIAPTDAMVEVLIQKKLLHPLDRTQLPEAAALDTRLMGAFYDPTNTYALPFSWTPIGIGYDSRVIQLPPCDVDWDLIFGRVVKGKLHSPATLYGNDLDKVCVGEDPIETLSLAMIYLYGRVLKNVTPLQERQLVAVLRKQKEWVECYSNNLRHFLISGTSPAVIIPGAYMIKTVEQHKWASFSVPSSGSIMFVGNAVLLASSTRKEESYKVMNYLFSEEGSDACYKNHLFIPANTKSYRNIPQEVRSNDHLFPEGALFENISLLTNAIPLKKFEHMWQQAIV